VKIIIYHTPERDEAQNDAGCSCSSPCYLSFDGTSPIGSLPLFKHDDFSIVDDLSETLTEYNDLSTFEYEENDNKCYFQYKDLLISDKSFWEKLDY
jgi:hypothetical protein